MARHNDANFHATFVSLNAHDKIRGPNALIIIPYYSVSQSVGQ